MTEAFIYMWTNKVNGRRYIGSHVGHELDGYVGSGVAFRRAVSKYGIDNFERIIIEYTTREDVLAREQYFIDLYDAANDKQFYNIKVRAGGGFEHVNSLSHVREANKERLKVRWHYQPHPKGYMGKQHSEETKLQISESGRRAAKSRTYNAPKPVLQYDLYGNYVGRHESITDAAKAVGGRPSNIKYMIEGKFKKAYNYVWKYDKQHAAE